MSRIYKGVERAGIKGAVHRKMCRLSTRRDPRKLKKPLLKRRPKRRSIVHRLLPPTLTESMHLGFSPLLAHIFTIMSIQRLTYLLFMENQSLTATESDHEIRGNYCAACDLEMT